MRGLTCILCYVIALRRIQIILLFYYLRIITRLTGRKGENNNNFDL